MGLHVSWKLTGSILIFSCLVHCLYAQGKLKDYIANCDNQRSNTLVQFGCVLAFIVCLFVCLFDIVYDV